MAHDDCADFAIHDLAALSEGNLSPEGIERLAGHLQHCEACVATLVTLVGDAAPARGTADVTAAANLVKTLHVPPGRPTNRRNPKLS